MQKYVLKKFTKTKLLSSSITEVVVALSICMIIFFISMTVIMNSQKNNNILSKQEAQLIISTVDEYSLSNDSIDISNKLILKTDIQESDSYPGLYKLNFAIYNRTNQRLAMKTVWTSSDNIPVISNRNFTSIE